MSGAYYAFGQLRETALRLAIDSEDTDTERIVGRAESYFQFLVAGSPDDQI